MCDFGVSETIAGVTAGVVAGSATAAAAETTAAVAIPTTIAAAASGSLALAPEVGTLAALGTSLGAGSTVAQAAGAGTALGLSEWMGIASAVLGIGGSGASGGVSAKQAKDQNTLINAQAKAERRNTVEQANQSAEASAQSNFDIAVAAMAGRGNAQAANVSDRSVRAITRAVGFQEGTDKTTVRRNQEIVNATASARLQGIAITKQSQQLQVGSPAAIAGTGAVNAVSQGLYSGAGAYQAFSKFRIPTDGPNLAFA